MSGRRVDDVSDGGEALSYTWRWRSARGVGRHFSAEVGRERQALARADAPYIDPVVPAVGVGIQGTTIVDQDVLGAIERCRRPPAPEVSIAERATSVLPTGNWRKSEYVGGTVKAIYLVFIG